LGKLGKDGEEELLDLALSGASEGNGQGVIVKLIYDDGETLRLPFSNVDEEALEGIGLINVSGIREIINRMARRMMERGGSVEFADLDKEYGRHLRIICEALENRLNLIIFGAGHVGRVVAHIGGIVGYRVVLVDDREEFLRDERLSGQGVEFVEEKFEGLTVLERVAGKRAIVIVTRGHQYDEMCLKKALDMGADYIGMIGSRRRVLSVFSRLERQGCSGEALSKVFAPIGLRIGAVSPEEIGVAIVAEIIGFFNVGRLEGAWHLKG
jgi:xanthine/CO dehydrogenase XdhC/CoxF family maturation factor